MLERPAAMIDRLARRIEAAIDAVEPAWTMRDPTGGERG
jgi:hypothetical protein